MKDIFPVSKLSEFLEIFLLKKSGVDTQSITLTDVWTMRRHITTVLSIAFPVREVVFRSRLSLTAYWIQTKQYRDTYVYLY